LQHEQRGFGPNRGNNMNKVDIYHRPEFYNPRVRATIPGAWIAETDRGYFAICDDYEADSAEAALAILNTWGAKQYTI
jgi:hypothetical protein